MANPHRPLADRLWEKVDKSGDCWVWTGTRSKGRRQGYGLISAGNRTRHAHRIAYVLANGQIPAGMVIHHRCRNKLCVNPGHLELLSRADNSRRDCTTTECIRGHQWTVENTRIDRRGIRVCRACVRWHRRKARAKASARRVAALATARRALEGDKC